MTIVSDFQTAHLNVLNVMFDLLQFVIGQHFMARVIGLIIIPVITYMFYFGVHFQALPLR